MKNRLFIMKKFSGLGYILLIFLFSNLQTFGQNIDEIEKSLVEQIKNIEYFSAYGNNSDHEKLSVANELFKKTLLEKTSVNPETLKYKFPELDKHLHIATSEDGKLRIYSWDTRSGGTMHFFENVYQYIGKDGIVYSKGSNFDEGDPGGFFSDISTLDTNKGSVYLTRFSSVLSTSLAYQSINLFKIENNSLNEDYKLFKTKTGIKNSIGFSFDFFSVVDRPERPIELIFFDKPQKSVKIPIVIEDEKTPQGRVTNRFIVYKFTGKYFEKIR